MTTTAKSNTIFGNGVVLHGINVMNAIAPFSAKRAGIVVAFANHTFEQFIESWRILFKRLSVFPVRGIFSRQILGATLSRTKLSIYSAWRLIIDFLTIFTGQIKTRFFENRWMSILSMQIYLMCFIVYLLFSSIRKRGKNHFPIPLWINIFKKLFFVFCPKSKNIFSSIQIKSLGARFNSCPSFIRKMRENKFSFFRFIINFQKNIVFISPGCSHISPKGRSPHRNRYCCLGSPSMQGA